MKYDYLIVGSGLYGAVFAERKISKGKKCLIVERRDHIAGNIYSKKIEGIDVHMYGPHIFHTDNEEVWEYVNRFSDFNNFIYSPIAYYNGGLYNLPFNMNTFTRMWEDVKTPKDAKKRIEEQAKEAGIKEPKNLEEQAISLVGTDIYEKLIKHYTKKQWGRECKDLPADIIKRLPVRFTFNNNYFNHPHQGIPKGGYTNLIENMIKGADILLETDFLKNRDELLEKAEKIVYTGPIDEYYSYCFGELSYRSLRFKTEILNEENHQGAAGVNYTDESHDYTRVIEHKHFNPEIKTDKTIITYEYSAEWKKGDEPYYPVNDEKNNSIYEKYKELSMKEENLLFGGRLGTYRYLDMDKVIKKALDDEKRF